MLLIRLSSDLALTPSKSRRSLEGAQLSKSNCPRTLSGAAVGVPSPGPRVSPPLAWAQPRVRLGYASLVHNPGLEAQNLKVPLEDRCREWDGIREGKTIGRRTSGAAIPTAGSATPSRLQPPSSCSGLTRKASTSSLTLICGLTFYSAVRSLFSRFSLFSY